jgi:hypothetical protein
MPEPTDRPSTVMILSVAVDSRVTNLLELSVNRVAIRNPDDRDLRVGDDE